MVTSPPEESLYLTDEKPTLIKLSGDGTKLFYSNPKDANKLYRLDLLTGIKNKASDYTPVEIKVNYDGTMAAFKISNGTLYYYNSNLNNSIKTLDTIALTYLKYFDVQKNGTGYFYENRNYNVWYFNESGKTSRLKDVASIDSFSISEEKEKVYIAKYYNDSCSLIYLSNTYAGWKETDISI